MFWYLWSTSFKDFCERMQFLEKLEAIEIMQLCEK